MSDAMRSFVWGLFGLFVREGVRATHPVIVDCLTDGSRFPHGRLESDGIGKHTSAFCRTWKDPDSFEWTWEHLLAHLADVLEINEFDAIFIMAIDPSAVQIPNASMPVCSLLDFPDVHESMSGDVPLMLVEELESQAVHPEHPSSITEAVLRLRLNEYDFQ